MTTTSSLGRQAAGVGADAEPAARHDTPDRGERRAGWMFATPFLFLYVAFLIGPVLIGIVISLFNTTTVQTGLGDFVGFSNYADVLGSGDFWASMWHSVLFTLFTTPLLVLLPLLFAVLASRMARGQWFYRLAYFAPYVVPSSAVCLIFAFMYTPETGLITNAFGWFGLDAPNFFGTTSGAWFAVVLLTLWWTFGFNFILYTAAIQEISDEVYEAASIDGAGPWQQIRSDHGAVAQADDEPGADPAGPRLAQGLRPDLHPAVRRPELLHATGHPVHLRHGLHVLPRRLRRRRDDGLLRPAGGVSAGWFLLRRRRSAVNA